MSEIQVDLRAYMATLETTNEPLEMCYSCQRARLYASLTNAGGVKVAINRAIVALGGFAATFPSLTRALHEADRRINTLIETLGEFTKVDLTGSMPDAADLSDEDWAIALESFFRARCEHYVNEDGDMVLEPHNEDGMPDVFRDPDDGVPAK